MKKLIATVLLIIMLSTLNTCSSKTEAPKLISKEGIAPYELSESEEYILQSFGMNDTSQIITFHAPKEAISLNITVYRLGENKTWHKISEGGISIGTEREPISQLIGTFTMQLRENYVIDFTINSGGLASYKTDELILDHKITASAKVFLQTFQDIAINTEIPVALMVYDNSTSMKTYSLQDYFKPAVFTGMDLVQVVTLEFSDN